MSLRPDRPGLLFALIGLAGLILPLVQFKANRIVPGDGIAMSLPLAAMLAAILLAGCLRWSHIWRLAGGLVGLGTVVLALGGTAQSLMAQAPDLARVAPAAGFWLLLLAFCLMLTDAITRLRPALYWRWLMLAGAVTLVAVVLMTGWLDQVSVMREYAARRDAFLREGAAHLFLAFGSLGLSLLVGLPLGIAIHQSPPARGPVLSVLNILQTIPSLALFGIMIPIFGWIAANIPGAAQAGIAGIGVFPALVALFLYSLLPVVSNTLTGLSGVSPATQDAAVGLGLTRVQLLAWVLVPLALPVLLAAIRIVLVQNIGLAVIAGLIGGGGFGTFVFQGLNQTAMDLVLLGALPTIGLALVAGIALDLLVESLNCPTTRPA